jgi:hypothetical protein
LTFVAPLLFVALGCNPSPIRLGTYACAQAGGQCLAYPSGCPCGQWDDQGACAGVGVSCCIPGSCAPKPDLGPHVEPPSCAPAGAACVRNEDCCNSDCPRTGGGPSVCRVASVDMATPIGPGGDSCPGGQCVGDFLGCPRGHITGVCGWPGGDHAGQCCVPGTENVPCGATTCGKNQVCVEPCYFGVGCVPKSATGFCPPGTTTATVPCTDAGGAPGCSPSSPPWCVDLPTSCDLTSSAGACACFGSDPCSAGSCGGGEGPGLVSCFCPPAPTMCDAQSVTNFVAAHRSCNTAQDCVALCTLNASCDTRAISKSSVSAYNAAFGSCNFGACAIACFAPTCDMGLCS